MKLLTKREYDYIEDTLRKKNELKDENLINSINEVIDFFEDEEYKEFFDTFYARRNEYKNRYPNNSDMLYHLKKRLCCETTRIYQIRKDIVYKTAMVFYKNGILKDKESHENENRDD